MKHFLALDVGTTAVKAGLFSEKLERVALCSREYTLQTPQADIVELDPQTYWDGVCEVVRQALQQGGVDPRSVATITCATQGETLIPVDEKGEALHAAVVWLDARAKEEGRWIDSRIDRLSLYQQTGLPEVNGFTPLAKLMWFREHRPQVYEKAYKFLLLEDYLVLRLCGQYVTNPAVMCTTGYFDIQSDTLWREALDLCGLDAGKIPLIQPCGSVVGPLTLEASRALGLPESALVTTGTMDQVASAIGSGNTREGIVTETTGTCQAVAATVDKSLFAEWSPVTYYSHAIPGKLLKIVINQTAGIAYKWFRNEFCIDLQQAGGDAFDRMGNLAAAEPPLSRGLAFFPHMTGMQFPIVDEGVRGVFFGVGLDTGRGCFIRAVMEGVGYMLRESMEKMALSPQRVISLGGGAKSAIWGQIKADICNAEFIAPLEQESTALGAAMLGAVASGVYPSLEAASGRLCIRQTFSPRAEMVHQYQAGYQTYLNMYAQFAPLFHQQNEEGGKFETNQE